MVTAAANQPPGPDTGCAKKAFLSEMLATNWARLIELVHNDGVTRRAYQCSDCGDWHITRRMK
jgi:hypothetical protein